MELSNSNLYRGAQEECATDITGTLSLSDESSRETLNNRQHAVVVGASFSGLITARVLLNHFERVTIIEKDALDFDQPVNRKGQPQSPHQHLLLVRGRELIEQYFHGFNAELDAHGVGHLDYGGAVSLSLSEGVLPRYPTGIELRPCRRILIDHLLLKRLANESRIAFVDEASVTGLKFDRSREKVQGVFFKRNEQGRGLDADLVIDCSGRGSRLPKWLEQIGYSAPPTTTVDAKLGYASRLYTLPDDYTFEAIDVAPESPDLPFAAGLWPVENGQWLLTLIGMNGELPPRDEEGFRAFADRLINPRVAEFIDAATPVSDIVCHRGSANIWHQYQRTKLPDGILALGDAVCAYNPLHGQGISVAATVAQSLDRWLAKQPRIKLRRPVFSNAPIWFICKPGWWQCLKICVGPRFNPVNCGCVGY